MPDGEALLRAASHRRRKPHDDKSCAMWEGEQGERTRENEKARAREGDGERKSDQETEVTSERFVANIVVDGQQ